MGPQHPGTLLSAYNLGLVMMQSKPGGAEALFREALEGWCKVHGRAHPNTRDAYTALVHVLTAQGKAREAREIKAQYGGGK